MREEHGFHKSIRLCLEHSLTPQYLLIPLQDLHVPLNLALPFHTYSFCCVCEQQPGFPARLMLSYLCLCDFSACSPFVPAFRNQFLIPKLGLSHLFLLDQLNCSAGLFLSLT